MPSTSVAGFRIEPDLTGQVNGIAGANRLRIRADRGRRVGTLNGLACHCTVAWMRWDRQSSIAAVAFTPAMDRRIITGCGDVAQLGERRVRNAKVEGSIPFVSTNQFKADVAPSGLVVAEWPFPLRALAPGDHRGRHAVAPRFALKARLGALGHLAAEFALADARAPADVSALAVNPADAFPMVRDWAPVDGGAAWNCGALAFTGAFRRSRRCSLLTCGFGPMALLLLGGNAPGWCTAACCEKLRADAGPALRSARVVVSPQTAG